MTLLHHLTGHDPWKLATNVLLLIANKEIPMDFTMTLRPKLLLATAALITLAAIAVQAAAPSVAAQHGTYTPDEMHVVLGFTVEITGAGSGGDVDSAWETSSGGSLNIEVADSSVGTDQSHTTTPGHKYVDTLTLRGPLTAGVKATRGINEGAYEILENGAGKFRVELGDLPLDRIQGVSMEDLLIDVRELPGGNDGYRVYGLGDAHYGSITIRSRVGKDSKELYQWWLDASQGKSISISLLDHAGEDARRYNFLECFPTQYSPFNELPGVAIEKVVARCEGVKFEATGARKSIAEWLNATLNASSLQVPAGRGEAKSTGEPWKRTVTVKEILKDGAAGRAFQYHEAFPTRYVFPNLDAAGTGNLYEEIADKPIRLELS
jgi:phage tail-like protein